MGNLKLIAWSGGADSTLVLLQALKEQKTWFVGGEERHEVRSFAVNWSPVPQSDHQRAVRARLKAEFERRGLRFTHFELDLQSSPGGCSDRASQAFAWLGLAQLLLGEKEDLVVGWVRGDDVWHHIGEVRAAFAAIQTGTGRTGGLEAPLEWWNKPRVYQELREEHLADRVWWCEGPKGRRACGSCTPCETHALALYALRKNHLLKDDRGEQRPRRSRS